MTLNFIAIYFHDIDFWSEIKFASEIISRNIDSKLFNQDDLFSAVVKLASGYHFIKTMKSTAHQSSDIEKYIRRGLKIEYTTKKPEANHYDVQYIIDCNTRLVYTETW